MQRSDEVLVLVHLFLSYINICFCFNRYLLVEYYLRTKKTFLIVPRKESPVRNQKQNKTRLWFVCVFYCFFVFCLSVKPRKGDALLFFNLHPDAIPDPLSLHGGCPVIEGEKWSATKWIHVDSFDKIVTPGGNCTDMNESCERWAVLGECTKNPEYMVGTAELPGYCRRSCKAC